MSTDPGKRVSFGEQLNRTEQEEERPQAPFVYSATHQVLQIDSAEVRRLNENTFVLTSFVDSYRHISFDPGNPDPRSHMQTPTKEVTGTVHLSLNAAKLLHLTLSMQLTEDEKVPLPPKE